MAPFSGDGMVRPRLRALKAWTHGEFDEHETD